MSFHSVSYTHLGVPTEYFEVMADARELDGWRDREDICLAIFEQPQRAQQLICLLYTSKVIARWNIS